MLVHETKPTKRFDLTYGVVIVRSIPQSMIFFGMAKMHEATILFVSNRETYKKCIQATELNVRQSYIIPPF